MSLKTRIAPTPSGYLHFGNLFSFGLTWLKARKAGLQILLRIDDLDRRRYRPEYLADIFRSLDALGIDYDEGPSGVADFEKNWSQLHRVELYRKKLEQLKAGQLVFPCSCSRREIVERQGSSAYDGYCLTHSLDTQKKQALRLKLAQGEAPLLNWRGKARTESLSSEMAYPVLYSKDAHVAYQLSSLCDDLHYSISHIVRGEDLWESSVCQFLIADLLEEKQFKAIRFHHHPLVLKQGEKLSKSKAAPAAEIYNRKANKKALLKKLAEHLGIITSGESLPELLERYQAEN